jgi:hypothetical protein
MNRILDTVACKASLMLLAGFTGWPPVAANVPCESAGHRTYIRGGLHYEAFYLDGQFIFENQIFNQDSHTRTHPGWVLQDDGKCRWANSPPPRIAGLKQLPSTIEQPPQPTSVEPQSMTVQGSPIEGDGGGALLLLLGVIGAGGYAFFQQRNSKEDFADDYHPMEDAPALPMVYTDENLDAVYERQKYPQYQGITEPVPLYSQQVYPQSQQPAPPPTANPSSPVTPTNTAVTGSDFVTTTAVTGDAGDDAAQRAKEQFEYSILPAPKGGYELSDESLLNKGQAYQIVWTAVYLGYSKNWLCDYVFKIPKGGNGTKYKLLTELVNRVKQELGL